MVYPVHDLLSFGGTIGTGSSAEIWQCNIRGLVNVTPFDRTAWLANRGPALAAFFADGTNLMRSDAALTFVKLNAIAADGTYVNQQQTYQWNTNTAGGTAPTGPDFISVAWSWYTDVARGPSSHGRIYTPNTWTPAASGSTRISSANAALHAAAARRLLILVTAAVSGVGYFAPAVVSKVGAGSSSAIRGTRVGDVLDVQRRRKNKLREAYTVLAV